MGRNIKPKQQAAYLTKNTPDVEVCHHVTLILLCLIVTKNAGKGVSAGRGNGRVARVKANPGGGGGRGVVFLRGISSWPGVRSE